MTATTRVLALNGSPRGEHSNTHALLTPFLEGAEAAGAEVQTFIVKDLDIGFCRGCFTCWAVTPGRCCQDDDMTAVLAAFRRADYVVFATPLYHFGMTALLKRLLERTLPTLDPHIVQRGDRSGHRLRPDTNRWRAVVISNCGFPDRVHFEALLEHFKHLTGGGRGLAAAICVAAGEALGRTYTPGGPFEWLWAALRRAGQEVVTAGHLSPETAEILARPLLPAEDYVRAANAGWDAQLARRSGSELTPPIP